MKTFFKILFIQILMINISSADSFSDAISYQKLIANKQQESEFNSETSEQLKKYGDQKLIELFRDFYRSAKKAGVSFNKLTAGTTKSRDGMGSTDISHISEDGEFGIQHFCILFSCSDEPVVNISGYGNAAMSIYYDDERTDGNCGNGTITTKCTCRLVAFNSHYSFPCEDFLTYKSITDNTKERVSEWLSKAFANDIEARSKQH